MKFLEGLILTLIIICWFGVILIIFLLEKAFIWTGIVGVLLFLLLYSNANYFIISRLRKFANSDWTVFKIKIRWANSWAIFIFLLLLIILESLKDKI